MCSISHSWVGWYHQSRAVPAADWAFLYPRGKMPMRKRVTQTKRWKCSVDACKKIAQILTSLLWPPSFPPPLFFSSVVLAFNSPSSTSAHFLVSSGLCMLTTQAHIEGWAFLRASNQHLVQYSEGHGPRPELMWNRLASRHSLQHAAIIRPNQQQFVFRIPRTVSGFPQLLSLCEHAHTLEENTLQQGWLLEQNGCISSCEWSTYCVRMCVLKSHLLTELMRRYFNME